MTRFASIEAEDEFVEIILKMLFAQAVIDAERPGLKIGEHAMDPRQHDMGSHLADDMRVMGDIGGAGISGPSVGFDRCALRHIGGDEAMQRCGREVLDFRETNAPWSAASDFDRANDAHFALGGAPAASCDRIILGPQGSVVSSTSAMPPSGERDGATMLRRSLAASSHADL